MTLYGAMRSPAITLFGSGQRAALPSLLKGTYSRAFICSDNRFNQDPKLVAIADSLKAAGIEVMVDEGAIAELPVECVYAATERARAFAPDVVIGIGGGSSLDIAKLVALLLAHPGPLSEYYGELKVPGPAVPVVAIPTTAGTGSETTPVAVIADPERTMKVGISSPYLIPRIALCDPELTLTCPPGLTAVTGADALTHAIEAFTARRREVTPALATSNVFIGKNTISDAAAIVAIRALTGHLAIAVEDGQNLEAREQVMLGAFMAGQAFGVAGTAAAHAIQYPVGALTHTAHGLGVAAMMPYVMQYNRDYCLDSLAEIGRIVGVSGGSEAELADAAIDWIAKLFDRIGIPATLAELGLAADKQGFVAEQSMQAARLVNNNPRPLDVPGMEKLVAAAFAGDRAALKSA